MIAYALFLYYFFTAGAVALITLSLARSQSLVGKIFQEGVVQQIASKNWVRQASFISFIFLETPLILCGICMGFLYRTAQQATAPLLSACFFYTIAIALVSAITIIWCSFFAENFIRAITAHPWKGSSFFNRLILGCSLLQTPLIITLLTIFLNTFYLDHLKSIGYEAWLLPLMSGVVVLCLSIAAGGVVIGIARVIDGFSSLCITFPSVAEKYSGTLFVEIGLAEAPIVFPFIVNFLLSGLYFREARVEGSLVGILLVTVLFLGIMAGKVSATSGALAKRMFLLFSLEEGRNKGVFSHGIFSQILLDTRVLYQFVLTIIMMIRMKFL